MTPLEKLKEGWKGPNDCEIRDENGPLDEARYSLVKLHRHIPRLVKALDEIANHPHSTYPDEPDQYETGVSDGHRCAADIARAALALLEETVKE